MDSKANSFNRCWSGKQRPLPVMAVSLRLAAAIGLALLVSGCDKPPTVAIHEAGVYKGARDPLLEEAGSDAFRKRLRDRMQMVQTDR